MPSQREFESENEAYKINGHPERDALFFADLLVDAKRAGEQFLRAGQRDGFARKQTQGNEKAQGASAFTAGQHGIFGDGEGIEAGDGDRFTVARRCSAQGGQAVEGGQHVLAVGDAVDHAFACRECAADEQTVCHALGRRGLHGAATRTGADLNFHSVPPTDRWLRSSRRCRGR